MDAGKAGHPGSAVRVASALRDGGAGRSGGGGRAGGTGRSGSAARSGGFGQTETDRASVGFDRLRPRAVGQGGVPAADPGVPVGRDAYGKRALYSGINPPAVPSARLAVRCSQCRRVSNLTLRQALRVLLPSLHLPLPLPHPSLARCPSCQRLTWVRLGLRGGSGRPEAEPARGSR